MICSSLELHLGGLREAMAGVHNLEQLAPSRYIGSAVVLQLVVDVRINLAEFATHARMLCEEFDAQGLCISSTTLERYAQRTTERCLAMLHPIQAPLRAKDRLSLEANIQGFSRRLRSILENFEFLTLSITARPVELDLKELLSSRTERRNDRPHRLVPIAGPGLLEIVSLPVHVVLLGLGIWYSSLQKEGVGLFAERVTDALEIRFAQLHDTENIAHFFDHTPSAVSRPSVELGLQRAGIQCFERGNALRLPLLADPALPR